VHVIPTDVTCYAGGKFNLSMYRRTYLEFRAKLLMLEILRRVSSLHLYFFLPNFPSIQTPYTHVSAPPVVGRKDHCGINHPGLSKEQA
jgi:hypothetical protein